MAPLNIVTVPNRILTRTARRIERGDVNLDELFAQMVETMSGEGVGLAAPQIGKSIRFFIAHDPETGEIRPFVNPHLTWQSDDKEVAAEGCLSIPGAHAFVERSLSIRLRFQDLDFAEHDGEFSGWYARILQHEYDHLNGVLISDRAVDGMHADPPGEEPEEVASVEDVTGEAE